MAKSKEHDTVTVVVNGKTQTRVVQTQVKDGKLVPDDQSTGSSNVIV